MQPVSEAQSPPSAASVFLVLKALAVAVLLFSSFYAWQNLSQIPARVSWHWANSMVEPQPVWGAMRVARQEALYVDFTKHRPVVPLTYGSLTYLVPGKLAALAGTYDARGVTRLGRLVSACGYIACLLLAVFLARQRGASWLVALLAPVPLFWFPYMGEWSGKFLPDFPALAFSLAGWMVAAPVCKRCKFTWPRTTMAALLWLIAWHFKPIVLTGIIAYFLESIWEIKNTDRWRKIVFKTALPLLLLLAGISITAAFAMHQTNGLWYRHLVVTAAHQHWSLKPIWANIHGNKEGWLIPILVAIAVTQLKRSRLALAVICEAVLAIVMMGKEGSNLNYLTGMVILSGILLSVLYWRAWVSSVLNATVAGIAMALICVVLALNVSTTRIFMQEIPTVTRTDVNKIAGELPADHNGVYCTHPYFALVYGLPCPFMDGFHAIILERDDMVSFKNDAAALATGQFQLIAGDALMLAKPMNDHGSIFPATIARAIQEHYTPVAAHGILRVVRYSSHE